MSDFRIQLTKYDIETRFIRDISYNGDIITFKYGRKIYKYNNKDKTLINTTIKNKHIKKKSKIIDKKIIDKNDEKIYPILDINQLELMNNKPYDVIIVTPFYKRKEIFNIFLKNLYQLREVINLHAILIGSKSFVDEDKLVKSYNFDYVYYPNKPLSNKWNYGVSILKRFDFNGLVVMGSDNLISQNLLERLMDKMVDFDVCGVLDLYVYNQKLDDCVHFKGYPESSIRYGETIGAGRLYSKKLLKKFNYKLWSDNKNKSLDRDVTLKLKNVKIYTTKIKKDEYLIDIKGGNEQITNFKHFQKCEKINLNKMNIKILNRIF